MTDLISVGVLPILIIGLCTEFAPRRSCLPLLEMLDALVLAQFPICDRIVLLECVRDRTRTDGKSLMVAVRERVARLDRTWNCLDHTEL